MPKIHPTIIPIATMTQWLSPGQGSRHGCEDMRNETIDMEGDRRSNFHRGRVQRDTTAQKLRLSNAHAIVEMLPAAEVLTSFTVRLFAWMHREQTSGLVVPNVCAWMCTRIVGMPTTVTAYSYQPSSLSSLPPWPTSVGAPAPG